MIGWECCRRRIDRHEACCFAPKAVFSGHASLWCLIRFVLGQLNAVDVVAAGRE
jgi:hypothetical protein